MLPEKLLFPFEGVSYKGGFHKLRGSAGRAVFHPNNERIQLQNLLAKAQVINKCGCDSAFSLHIMHLLGEIEI